MNYFLVSRTFKCNCIEPLLELVSQHEAEKDLGSTGSVTNTAFSLNSTWHSEEGASPIRAEVTL